MGGVPAPCQAETDCCRRQDRCDLTRFGGSDEAKRVDDDAIVFTNGYTKGLYKDDQQKVASPSEFDLKPGEEYRIVLDKSSGEKLGIDVDYVAERDSLPVRTITGGLVGMWNAAHPDLRVQENDHIVEVNGDRQVVDVLMSRLRHDTLLKISLRRLGRQLAAICHLGPNGRACRLANDYDNPVQGRAVTGTVRLTRISESLCRIEYEISGLSPGKHGFHVHEKADFSDGCASAGPIYNPHRKAHGGPDDEERQVGDLGNVEADSKGVARGVINDRLVKLDGEHSVIGRSMMVHAGPDDLGKGDNSEPGPPPVNGRCSKVTGNSGARLACGEIKLVA